MQALRPSSVHICDAHRSVCIHWWLVTIAAIHVVPHGDSHTYFILFPYFSSTTNKNIKRPRYRAPSVGERERDIQGIFDFWLLGFIFEHLTFISRLFFEGHMPFLAAMNSSTKPWWAVVVRGFEGERGPTFKKLEEFTWIRWDTVNFLSEFCSLNSLSWFEEGQLLSFLHNLALWLCGSCGFGSSSSKAFGQQALFISKIHTICSQGSPTWWS